MTARDSSKTRGLISATTRP